MNDKDNSKLDKAGERLKDIRIRLALKQETIANTTGVKRIQVCQVETGKRKPPLEYLLGLVDKLNVNINYVLTGEGAMFLDATNEDEEIRELIKFMKKDKTVKYSVLAFLHEYIKSHKID